MMFKQQSLQGRKKAKPFPHGVDGDATMVVVFLSSEVCVSS